MIKPVLPLSPCKFVQYCGPRMDLFQAGNISIMYNVIVIIAISIAAGPLLLSPFSNPGAEKRKNP
jgi:hypothetical protein